MPGPKTIHEVKVGGPSFQPYRGPQYYADKGYVPVPVQVQATQYYADTNLVTKVKAPYQSYFFFFKFQIIFCSLSPMSTTALLVYMGMRLLLRPFPVPASTVKEVMEIKTSSIRSLLQ